MPEPNQEAQKLAAEQAAIDAQKAELAKQQADFAEQQSKLQAEQAELAKQKHETAKAEIASFAETLIKEGRVLPKDKLALVEFMSSLKSDEVLEFGEGDAKTKTAVLPWFKSFMTGLPKQT